MAIAGSQIETAIFLKKLDANKMMTNTAAQIILAMTIFAEGMGVISSATVQPASRTECHTDTEPFCETFMKYVYRVTIPGSLVFVIVFTVMGFTVFRTHQYKKKRNIECNENRQMDNTDGRSDEALQGQGRLFTVPKAISELNRGSEENQETPSDNLEDDIGIGIENIELVNIATRPSPDQLLFGVMIQEITNEENTRKERIKN